MTVCWHPVIDLFHLAKFVLQTPFLMETMASVLLSVREGDFLASIDLYDVYFLSTWSSGIEEALVVPVGWGGLPVQGPVLFTTDYPSRSSPGCFCSGLSMGSIPRDSASRVPGRLTAPRLLGGHGHKGCLGSALALSLPRVYDKQGEVKSRTLEACTLPQCDHRFWAHQSFPALAWIETFLSVAERFSCCVYSPS